MRTFSEALSEIVKESDLSIYGMAKAIECDRTMLNKVISGDRKINLGMFLDIYAYLRNSNETYRLEELYELFWEEYLGNKEYEIVKYIRTKLYNMKKDENKYEEINGLKFVNIDIYEYITAHDIKQKAIIEKLYAIILNVINEHKNIKLYVHLPVYWKEVMTFIKFAFSINEVRTHIELTYIHTGYNRQYNEDFILIANYLVACEFALNGISTYDKNNWCRLDDENDIMPYYVVSEKEIFFMQKNMEIVGIENSGCTYESIIKTVNNTYNENKKFNNIMSYDNYVKILINSINDNSQCINIGGRIPFMLFCTRGTFDKIINNNRKDKERFINMLEVYYKNVRGKKCDVMISENEILSFMNDYSVNETYFEMSDDDKDVKLEILNNIYKYYIKNKESLFTVLNNEKCNIPKDLSIAILSEKRICATGYLDIEGKRKKTVSVIDSVSLCRHFINFYQYITYSNMSLKIQEMLQLLDGIINVYKK